MHDQHVICQWEQINLQTVLLVSSLLSIIPAYNVCHFKNKPLSTNSCFMNDLQNAINGFALILVYAVETVIQILLYFFRSASFFICLSRLNFTKDQTLTYYVIYNKRVISLCQSEGDEIWGGEILASILHRRWNYACYFILFAIKAKVCEVNILTRSRQRDFQILKK